jgi:hypothetical protein
MGNIIHENVHRNNKSAPKEFLLATLRAEYLRGKEWLVDLQALGITLRGGLISPAQAAEHMRDLDILSPLAKRIEERAA